jgi:protein KIBRA
MGHPLTKQPLSLQDTVSALLEQTVMELEKRQEGRGSSQMLEDSW